MKDFLSNFSATVPSFQTIVAGDVNLQPEFADSHTYGFVVQPRMIPGFSLSADYLQITVKGLVSTLTTPTANTFCVDSTTYPDTRPQTGIDLCPYTVRDSSFRISNGSLSGFWNQGAVRVKAININGSYGFNIGEVFGDGQTDFGRFGLRTQAYYLMEYASSPNGTFDANTTFSQNRATDRPKWEVQLVGNYSRGPLRLSWTGNWQSETRALAGNGLIDATIDQVNIAQTFRSYWIHSATVGYDINERTSAQFIVNNVFDTVYPTVSYAQSLTNVSLGRTLRGQLIYKF